MSNLRTTIVGIASGAAILLTQLVAVIDGDPATGFSTEACLMGLGLMGVGWFAKDASTPASPPK